MLALPPVIPTFHKTPLLAVLCRLFFDVIDAEDRQRTLFTLQLQSELLASASSKVPLGEVELHRELVMSVQPLLFRKLAG